MSSTKKNNNHSAAQNGNGHEGDGRKVIDNKNYSEEGNIMNASIESSTNSVSRAKYPIPQPLAQALEAAIAPPPSSSSVNQNVVLELESPSDALKALVENAITAIDTLYFATPPVLRRDESFQHRLCLRVATDKAKKTLTVTDLGIGMTRADLINMLGIGRPTTSTVAPPGVSLEYDDDDDDDNDDEGEDDNDDDGEEDEDEDIYDDDDDDDKHNHRKKSAQSQQKQQQPADLDQPKVISCHAKDLGGFYAALCTLGIGVRVGTKSKFDDYYEFQVGKMHDDNDGDTKIDSFVIKRPMDEGSDLTVESGFGQFAQVRGDSGTSVTIQLKSCHLDLLDEERVLQPMLTKLLETTQYTVAFSTSSQAQEIIDASKVELERREALLKQQSQVDEDPNEGVDAGDDSKSVNAPVHNSVKERAKYIPLRLSLGERKMLRLVEAAMNCCDYTTSVDRPFTSKVRRTHQQLKGVTSVLKGLVTACDYEAGKALAVDSSSLPEYEDFLRRILEIARRHKIMNPEKMRTEYGKLIYLLQDAVAVQNHIGISNIVTPIETVYKFLQERDGLGLLEDKWIETATEEILAEKKSRAKIDSEIKRKERAVQNLKRKYRSSKLSMDDIHLCLYSICDNNSFLNSNRVPIDKVIDFLQKHFAPDKFERGYSLAIISGQDGARLSHSHERQYYFALQSLTLWRDIVDDMFRLWAMMEGDLLSDAVPYSLQDTGQGMQRVQQSPRTYKAMQQILIRVQAKVSHWVGSSVIHLGDHNVPNALSFIDKYTQVPRILGPIVACLENLEKLCEEDYGIQDMIDEGFGGLKNLRKDILYDFFRSAFDGSGADNFYDAGSCIDGRLTSAWNWCSQLPNKPFYPIFKLTGFTGFDGEFK